MPIYQKARVRPGVKWKSTSRSYQEPAIGATGTLPREVQWIQTENHRGYKTSGGTRDLGGPFESQKLELSVAGYQWISRWNYQPKVQSQPTWPWGWQYDTDTFLVASPEVAQLVQASLSDPTVANLSGYLSARVPSGPNSLTMNAMGSKAIDLVKPTNPTVDLATSLAELWSERSFFSVPGSSGSIPGEYLNYQFGIAPTLSDFSDLRKAIENRDAIIRQYQRDSGKPIRREYRFNPDVQTSRTVSNAPVHSMGTGLSFYQNPGGVLTKVTTTTQKFWFAGAFRYSIPRDAFPKELWELDRLYGVVPGVSTGWELIPFSWLVDYFVPIGSILSNLDDFLKNGLVLPYGYIMSTTEVEDRYEWKGPVSNMMGALTTIDVTSVVTKTRLRRLPANPFGFGLLASDLSPKQLSIIAALGLTLRK